MSDPQEDARGPVDSAQDLEWVEPEELEPADDPLGDTLRAANSRYALALSTADAATLCDLFEPDGAIVDGSGPDVLGHEGLRDMAHYARERFAAGFAVRIHGPARRQARGHAGVGGEERGAVDRVRRRAADSARGARVDVWRTEIET